MARHSSLVIKPRPTSDSNALCTSSSWSCVKGTCGTARTVWRAVVREVLWHVDGDEHARVDVGLHRSPRFSMTIAEGPASRGGHQTPRGYARRDQARANGLPGRHRRQPRERPPSPGDLNRLAALDACDDALEVLLELPDGELVALPMYDILYDNFRFVKTPCGVRAGWPFRNAFCRSRPSIQYWHTTD